MDVTKVLFVEFDFDKDFGPGAPDGTPASEDFFTAPMPSKCAVGNILILLELCLQQNNVKGTPKTAKISLTLKNSLEKELFTKVHLSNLELALAADGIKPGKGGLKFMKALKLKVVLKELLLQLKNYVRSKWWMCILVCWSSTTRTISKVKL